MIPGLQPNTKKWPLSRKATLLLASGLALLAILSIVVIAVLRNGNSISSTDATFYDRPGYDRTKLGSAYADPFAVKFSLSGIPVNYQGNAVVQACNVLTLDNLIEQGIAIKANTLPTPISRVINDGVGEADYPKTVYASLVTGKSLGNDVNSCNYALENDSDVPMVLINTFQPFSVPSDIIDAEILRNYTATGSIEGLELFTKKPSSSSISQKPTEYIAMQRGKGAFYLMLELSEDQADKKQILLEAAAKNFVREQDKPSGIAQLEYDSPIFKKSITPACSLISNEDIRSLSGRDAGPLAREGIASSIGSLVLPNDQMPQLNVSNECTRSTVGGGSGLGNDGPGDLALTVEATSFLSNAPAKRVIELSSQPSPKSKGGQILPIEVGDAGIAYSDSSGGFRIMFAKSRFVVDIKFDQRSSQVVRATSLASAVEKLTPIARSMANKIKE